MSKLIKRPLALKDGKIATAHSIQSFEIDLQTFVLSLVVDSWLDTVSLTPDYTQTFKVSVTSWNENSANYLKKHLLSLPEWSAIAVAYTPEQILLSKKCPSSDHYWDAVARVWVDKRSLLELKASKNIEINMARLSANRSFFTFAGKRISVDELSRGDIDAVHGQVLFSNALPVDWQGAWKGMDNDYVPIPDVATWGLLYSAMVQQGTVNFNHAQELKQKLSVATTSVEVTTIHW